MKTVKIKSIKKIPRRDRYDLTINTTHNFFANGVLIHNTSARTGYLPVYKNLSPLQLWLKLYFGFLFFWLQRSMQWTYVSGTRNVVMDPVELTGDTYYSGTTFRAKIHEQIKAKGLHKGETLYYEIVGYTDTGAQIMPSHHVEDKELIKKYGNTMTYKYGCDPVLKPWRVLLYRITLTNEDGYVLEYSWDMVRARAKELDLEVVPELTRFIAPARDTSEYILNIVRPLSDGPDLLDPTHIREGVCLRVEDPNSPNDVEIYKYKGYNFLTMEGCLTNEQHMDMEEIASLEETE